MTAHPPFLVRTLSRTFARIRRYRSDARTARLIEELPVHIRKDIGWPDAHPPVRRR